MGLLLDGFTHRTIDTGEIEIGYSVGPDNGPTLLLLHGMSSRRDGFINVVEPLSKNHRIVTMDQRGHGYSSHTPGEYARENQVRDVVFVLENVCKEPAILWGHSMGGGNAASTVSKHPELATALVLEDSGLGGGAARRPSSRGSMTNIFAAHLELIESGMSAEDMAPKLQELSPNQPEYFAPWKAECLLQMDIEIIRRSVEGTRPAGGDPKEILSKIECPVLFLQADPHAGGSNTDEYLAEIIPNRENFKIEKIIGSGHNINREHTELLLPVVLPWLENLQ